YLWLIPIGGLLLASFVANLAYIDRLWVLRSFRLPSYGLLVLLAVHAASIGHELFHGWAAKEFGGEAVEIGLQSRYWLPSFYCRIMMPRHMARRKIAAILAAGSLFDAVAGLTLVLIWLAIPTGGWQKDALALTIDFFWIKILLLNLNPGLPQSDGYKIA